MLKFGTKIELGITQGPVGGIVEAVIGKGTYGDAGGEEKGEARRVCGGTE